MEILTTEFQSILNKEAKRFLSLLKQDNSKVIRIISHNDTDGITSGAIMAKILKRLNLKYWLSNVKAFNVETLKNLKSEKWDIAFILDFGLNKEKLEELNELNKDIFILDHHIIEKDPEYKKLRLISSYLQNQQLSASAITYLFGKEISSKNKDLVKIAIIGLIGDMMKVPKFISDDALENKSVEIRKSIKVFGTSTKPLHRALTSSRIFPKQAIEGENEVTEIIKQAGISLKDNGKYKTLLDLTEEEMRRLCTVIAAVTKNEDFIEYIYIINSGGRLYDSKELSAMINSCGRLDSAEAGIEACYGNLTKAEKVYGKYKKELVSALRWFEKSKEKENLTQACNGKVWLINAKKKIKDTIIGVLTSMLLSHYQDKLIIGMAENGSEIKISARATTVNVKEFLDKTLDGIYLEKGGHKEAAGGVIDKKNEKVFISRIKELSEW